MPSKQIGFTLSGAETNFENFSDVMSNGDTCWHFSTFSAGGWEVRLGTKATGVLQRTTVFSKAQMLTPRSISMLAALALSTRR